MTAPLRQRGFDFVVGSDIVYMPAHIPSLAESIDYFIADGGVALIANTAVATNTSHADARALFLNSLEKLGLQVEVEEAPNGRVFQACPDIQWPQASYFLRITRSQSPAATVTDNAQ